MSESADGRERSVIAKHLNAAIQEGELDAGINVQNLHKNLRGTRFRRWATKVLRDHLLKGFSVNARLNQLEDKVDRRRETNQRRPRRNPSHQWLRNQHGE